MDPQLKDEWIEALRSGEYVQAEGALRTEEDDTIAHCCLGVLCDIVKDRINGRWSRSKTGDYYFIVEEGANGSLEMLPNSVVEYAGLSDREVETSEGYMTCLNDGIGNTDKHNFDEIATIIEQDL